MGVGHPIAARSQTWREQGGWDARFFCFENPYLCLFALMLFLRYNMDSDRHIVSPFGKGEHR